MLTLLFNKFIIDNVKNKTTQKKKRRKKNEKTKFYKKSNYFSHYCG